MDDWADRADGSAYPNLNYDQCSVSFSGSTDFESHHESHKEDRPYKCNQCDKSYRHAGSLVNHKKTHQIGLYTCLICQKEYSNPMGLKSHLRTHSEEKRFKCEQCGEAFRMSQQLYNHRKSLHGYYSTPNGEKITRSPKFDVQSPVLVESSNLMSNLENYIAESMLPVDFPQLVTKYYQEEKAGDEGPAKEDAEGPEASTDEKDQPNDGNIEEYRYKCTQCEKAYKHAGSLANHRQSHMVGVYQCAVCFKEFSNLMAMKNHCRLHSDSRARRSCKSPRTSGRSTDVPVVRSDPPQTEALTSAEKANSPRSLHDSLENIKSEEDKEAVFIPQTHFQDELASSSSPTKPNGDNASDAPFSLDSVTGNMNKDETEEKANDLLVEQQEYDDAHEEDTKSGDRPFMCQECGKTYRHAGSLINHKKTHQTGVYSCSLCSKQMFNMAALKNHIRAHFKSRAGRRLGDSYFSSASLSDELYQNQEDSYQDEACDDISMNESDFLQNQLLHQKQELHEISNEKPAEEVPDLGIWQETPQASQGSSDDSAYSSGPRFPEAIKIEMNNLTLQQWSQEDSLAAPRDIKVENRDGADVQNAEASFEKSQPNPIASKEEEFSGLEEHCQTIDDRPHKCDLCGRTYRHKSSLINHKLTHKTGIYQCSLCPKQYPNLMALRNHVRFHSRSYAGRRGIASRRGRQFFRTKPRFLQNRTGPLLTESVKLNEGPRADTTRNRAVKEFSHGSQSHRPCGKSLDHFETCGKDCPSAITESPTLTNVQCEISIATSTEKDLSKEKELVKPQEKVMESLGNHRRRVYECDLCSKSYRHSGSLINHKRTHQTGDYMCPYCSKHVHNMAALKNHIRIHHKVKKGHQGDVRVNPSLLYPDLSYPIDGKGLYSCGSCEEMFHTENELLAHQMVHIPLEGSQWVHQDPMSSSPEVNKDIPAIGDWNHSNNMEDEHKRLDSGEDNQSEYTCVECGEVYDHLDELNYHKRSHQTQAGIYQCSFCPKEYPNLLALRSHFETHTKPQVLRNTSLDASDENEFGNNQLPVGNHYDCGHCGLIFSNEGDFHQHQVAHEQQQVIAESLPGVQGEGQESDFSFSMHSSERELLTRIKSEIEETERSEASDGGPLLSHICGFCGKTYDDLESLEAHSLSHSNEEEASANENLHLKTELVENRKSPSPVSKDDEAAGSNLKTEKRPESRPYTCEQCGKTYRHGGSLVNHKKTHLVGNFQCVACSRRYHNLAAYRTHLRHHPKCKQSTALNNQLEQPASTLQNNIYPGKDESLLTFSPSSSIPLPPGDHDKCANDTSKGGSSIKSPSRTPFISRRRFSRRICRIGKAQTSEQVSSECPTTAPLNVTDVRDKKIQACEFCGKMFGVKDLALHLSGNCGSHSANSRNTLVARKEEIQDLPLLPGSALLQNEGETGFHRRPFRCEVCGRTYRHAGSLINHKQTHKTGIFRCSICQKRFFNLMAMKNHNRIHFELKRHKCLDCGKAFRLSKQLDTHQRIHRQRASARKLGRRNRRSRYRRLAQGHHQKMTTQVKNEGSSLHEVNDIGGKSFNSRVKRLMDPDSRPYQCEECGRSYRHAGSLFNHKKSHKTGQYHCSVCDKTYSNLMALKNHQRTHYEAKRHPCPQCGKTFKWKRQLVRHQLVHIQEEPHVDSPIPKATEKKPRIADLREENSTADHDASNVDQGEVSNDVDPIVHAHNNSVSLSKPVCVSCGLSFADQDESENHICKENCIDASASRDGEAKVSTQCDNKEERPYKCDVCDRSYIHASSLHTHKLTHKKGNYKCSVCPKEFLNFLAMKAHLRTHATQKRLQCRECGETFRTSQELTSHTAVHSGAKPFRCSICGREFSCRLTLRHHQRTHKLPSSSSQSSSTALPPQNPNDEEKTSRTGASRNLKDQDDRKYKCKQCGRSYLHAGSLFNHRKTHNIGVYKCPNCLKVFSNLLAFKNHLRIHRYNCKECGKAFRNYSDMVSHAKVHEEGSFTCSLCDKHFLCQSSFRQHQRIHNPQDGDLLDPQPVSNFMVEVT